MYNTRYVSVATESRECVIGPSPDQPHLRCPSLTIEANSQMLPKLILGIDAAIGSYVDTIQRRPLRNDCDPGSPTFLLDARDPGERRVLARTSTIRIGTAVGHPTFIPTRSISMARSPKNSKSIARLTKRAPSNSFYDTIRSETSLHPMLWFIGIMDAELCLRKPRHTSSETILSCRGIQAVQTVTAVTVLGQTFVASSNLRSSWRFCA